MCGEHARGGGDESLCPFWRWWGGGIWSPGGGWIRRVAYCGRREMVLRWRFSPAVGEWRRIMPRGRGIKVLVRYDRIVK